MSASIPANSPVGPAVAAVPPVDDLPLLPSRHTGWLMAAVMGMSVCQFLDMTIANVALPHMRASLGASLESISWVLTSFIIAGVLALPLTGWLSDRLGSRNLFIGASITFVLSSMLCGAATSLTQMVIFRAIQGMASAFIGPMSQTIMFDISRPTKQAQAMSIWGMVVMIGPISGPFLGGFLTETLNWRWVFYVNLPIGVPALAILWWLLPSRPIVRRQLDVFGAIILGLSLCSLQLMLDRGQGKDWFASQEVVIELVLALSAFWIFMVHSWGRKNPLFDPRLTRDPNFLMGLGFMVILGVANVALSSLLPTFFQTIYGYNVIETGRLMAPRGVGVFLTMLVTNRLMGKVDGRMMISIGYLLAAASLWMMTRWSLDMGSREIMIAGFIQGLGLGLVFVPVNLIAFSTLAPHFRTDGSMMMTLFRNLGSSFGISVIVTTLARNIQTSHADIAANVTSFNIPAIDPASTAATFGSVGNAAMAMLDGEVNRQAAMIAYLDNFYMLFWIVLCFVPLSWVLKRPKTVLQR
jgi:MFS transporter, DHA2 family, multidrug resistance protein